MNNNALKYILKKVLSKTGKSVDSQMHDVLFIDSEGSLTCQTKFFTLYARSPWNDILDVGLTNKVVHNLLAFDELSHHKVKDGTITFYGKKNGLTSSFKVNPGVCLIPCTPIKRSDKRMTVNQDSLLLNLAFKFVLPFCSQNKAWSEYTGVTIDGYTVRTSSSDSLAQMKFPERLLREPITLPPYLIEILKTAPCPYKITAVGRVIEVTFDDPNGEVLLICGQVNRHARKFSDIKKKLSDDPILVSVFDDTLAPICTEIKNTFSFSEAATIDVEISKESISFSGTNMTVGELMTEVPADVVLPENVERSHKFVMTVEGNLFTQALSQASQFKYFLDDKVVRFFNGIKIDPDDPDSAILKGQIVLHCYDKGTSSG